MAITRPTGTKSTLTSPIRTTSPTQPPLPTGVTRATAETVGVRPTFESVTIPSMAPTPITSTPVSPTGITATPTKPELNSPEDLTSYLNNLQQSLKSYKSDINLPAEKTDAEIMKEVESNLAIPIPKAPNLVNLYNQLQTQYGVTELEDAVTQIDDTI